MRLIKVLFVTASLAIVAPVPADVLLINAMHEAADVPRPVRGMSMTDVEGRFGAPAQKHPAVGQPPITRWDYDRYSVYFEHQTVLHSVVHRKAQ
jgi:hypothetical protein